MFCCFKPKFFKEHEELSFSLVSRKMQSLLVGAGALIAGFV
jgi:hypothetical protein